jgi:hypothetical protein
VIAVCSWLYRGRKIRCSHARVQHSNTSGGSDAIRPCDLCDVGTRVATKNSEILPEWSKHVCSNTLSSSASVRLGRSRKDTLVASAQHSGTQIGNLRSLLYCPKCAILNSFLLTYSIDSGNREESDVKESPSLPRCERCEMRLTPLVVQLSDARWAAAPQLLQSPGQTSRPDQSDSAPLAKDDDIVGWPDELLIDFPDFPDCTLDSATDT